MELKICHLYPDLLSLNGDRGNILALRRRLEARGISAQVFELPAGKTADLSTFDLFFIGGGQDFQREALISDLRTGKDAEIRAAAEDGKVFLAVCGGYIAMCRSYTTRDGVEHEMIGVLDAVTVDKPDRLTGNSLFRCSDECGGSLVVGFEHHSGHTELGSGCAPLGTVQYGHGNNGVDGTVGARYKNVFATYTNGPILPKNPELADFILRTALERKYGRAELPPIDDSFETAAHDYMVERLGKK